MCAAYVSLSRRASADAYGVTVRADLTGENPVGRALQYEAGGYRDTEYPDGEGGTLIAATTDGEWHWVDVAVLDSSYAVLVDGVPVAAGSTSLACGGLFVRVVGGTAELRDLQVQPLQA